MNPGVVVDDMTIGKLFTQIETLVENSRVELNSIVSKYQKINTYAQLSSDPNKMVELYGNTADDYSKVCFLLQGATDAVIDVKSIRRIITSDNSGLLPMSIKTYKYRAESLLDILEDMREACKAARSGMEARVRYLSSMTYTSYDKVMGARC